MSNAQKYTLFNEYLDSIFYTGYADELAANDPESYKVQFKQFKNMYV